MWIYPATQIEDWKVATTGLDPVPVDSNRLTVAGSSLPWTGARLANGTREAACRRGAGPGLPAAETRAVFIEPLFG